MFHHFGLADTFPHCAGFEANKLGAHLPANSLGLFSPCAGSRIGVLVLPSTNARE
jgi:hypothetical protein